MKKTSYTVKVDGQKLDLEAWGAYSAASNAMEALHVTRASRVTVLSGNGERVSYFDVSLLVNGFLSYQRQD